MLKKNERRNVELHGNDLFAADTRILGAEIIHLDPSKKEVTVVLKLKELINGEINR